MRFTSYAVWWIKAFIKKFMYKSTKVHTGTLTHARELVSLDEQLGSDDATNSRLLDFLTDEDDPEKLFHVRQVSDNISSLLAESFRFLSKREVFILRKRFFSDPPLTLKQIADQLGVSRERVRQIEAKSIKKLKKILEDPQEGFWSTRPLIPIHFRETGSRGSWKRDPIRTDGCRNRCLRAVARFRVTRRNHGDNEASILSPLNGQRKVEPRPCT